MAYLLDRYGAFSENVIIKYTQQILRGIAYLHECHTLHRDLKGNVYNAAIIVVWQWDS